MAKIIKMTVYWVDPNDECSADEIQQIIYNDDWLPIMKVVDTETKSFEWDDDVIVNKCAATAEDYNQFFDDID